MGGTRGRSGEGRSSWCRPQKQRRLDRRRSLEWPDVDCTLYAQGSEHRQGETRRRCHGHEGSWTCHPAFRRDGQIGGRRAERRATARLQRGVERHRRMEQYRERQQGCPQLSVQIQGQSAQHDPGGKVSRPPRQGQRFSNRARPLPRVLLPIASASPDQSAMKADERLTPGAKRASLPVICKPAEECALPSAATVMKAL